MIENLLEILPGKKIKIDSSLGDIASPSDVLSGYQYSDGETTYTGSRSIVVTEYTHSTVTSSGVTGTAPGEILFAGYASGPTQGFYASPITISGNKYSLKCTNSSYQISNVIVRVAYLS